MKGEGKGTERARKKVTWAPVEAEVREFYVGGPKAPGDGTAGVAQWQSSAPDANGSAVQMRVAGASGSLRVQMETGGTGRKTGLETGFVRGGELRTVAERAHAAQYFDLIENDCDTEDELEAGSRHQLGCNGESVSERKGERSADEA